MGLLTAQEFAHLVYLLGVLNDTSATQLDTQESADLDLLLYKVTHDGENKPAREPRGRLVERLCIVMHDAYEQAAVGAGWETQQASRKPWSDVPEANKVTMRASVQALLTALGGGA